MQYTTTLAQLFSILICFKIFPSKAQISTSTCRVQLFTGVNLEVKDRFSEPIDKTTSLDSEMKPNRNNKTIK